MTPRMAARIEDFEWMLRTGESGAAIVARLGVSAVALNRALYRAGRADLAHFVTVKRRPVKRNRMTSRCTTCGGPCSAPRHGRPRACLACWLDLPTAERSRLVSEGIARARAAA